MVQRYEGISGKPRSAGLTGPPSPNTSRSLARAATLVAENGRYSKGQKQKDQVGLLTPMLSDAGYRQRSSSPTEDARMSPSPSRMSPINASDLSGRVCSEPSPLPHDAVHRTLEDALPRAPKLSFNREISKPLFTSGRKAVDDPSSRPGDERSISPERPYQGVGKLIDQWQRKTAEATTPRTTIGRGRGSFAATRGVLHSIPGRSQ
jgi:AP2-associated kinase